MVASLVNASPDLIYLIFGRRCMLASEPFWRTFLSISTFVATLDVAMRGLFGWRSEWIPDKGIVYRHLYSFSSVKLVCHWFQVIRYGRLQM
jgi:lysosomal acid lipase/cholesteryl ester hydrolase